MVMALVLPKMLVRIFFHNVVHKIVLVLYLVGVLSTVIYHVASSLLLLMGTVLVVLPPVALMLKNVLRKMLKMDNLALLYAVVQDVRKHVRMKGMLVHMIL